MILAFGVCSCPETSGKQETAKKTCCVRQGPQPDGRLDSRNVTFLVESSVELHPKRSAIHFNTCSGYRADSCLTIMYMSQLQAGPDFVKNRMERFLPYLNGSTVIVAQEEEDQVTKQGMASTVSRYEYY